MDSEIFANYFKRKKGIYLQQVGKPLPLETSYLEWLAQFDLSQLKDDDQKKAFWVNIYNGLTNYLIIKHCIRTSMKEDAKFFRRREVNIDGGLYSLDDIEHGILRKNARQHLDSEDKKLKYQVDQLDHRIHFALNCGGHSCPILREYKASSIHNDLETAEVDFVKENFVVEQHKRAINCSPIFKWYQDDFDGLYLNDPSYEQYTIQLMEYNWEI